MNKGITHDNIHYSTQRKSMTGTNIIVIIESSKMNLYVTPQECFRLIKTSKYKLILYDPELNSVPNFKWILK